MEKGTLMAHTYPVPILPKCPPPRITITRTIILIFTKFILEIVDFFYGESFIKQIKTSEGERRIFVEATLALKLLDLI